MIVAVTLYTRETPYEWAVLPALRRSCARLGVELDERPIDPRFRDGKNDWLYACHQIPVQVREALDEHPGDDLLYLDADATLERDPRGYLQGLLDAGVDFAVHHLDHGNGRRELLDGTMLVRNVERTRRLFEDWIDADAQQPGEWEQRVLERGLARWAAASGVRTWELPPELCLIYDHGRQRSLCEAAPMVVHHQASRRWKAWRPTGHRSLECLLLSLPEPVCVVGNGPVAAGAGPLVDSHRTVVRLNDARVAGHEDRVGRRTDLWVSNCWRDVPYRADLASGLYGAATVFHPDLDQHDVRGWADGAARGFAAPQQSWAEECARKLGISKPSTGVVLLYALRALEKAVTAVGFAGMRGGHYWDAAHRHDHPDEVAALRAMHVEAGPAPA